MNFLHTYKELDFILENKKNITFLPTPLSDVFYFCKNKDGYNNVDYFLPDGMPLVLYKRCFGTSCQRLYGPDVFLYSIEKTPNKKHLFLGSQFALKKIKKKLGHNDNFYYISLPYSNKIQNLMTNVLKKSLKEIDFDFIWIGIGSPKQVALASKIRFISNAKIGCVGATFDFVSSIKKQAPKFIQNIGFEWLFRLLHEPARLAKRYFVFSPIGLLLLPVFFSKIKHS